MVGLQPRFFSHFAAYSGTKKLTHRLCYSHDLAEDIPLFDDQRTWE